MSERLRVTPRPDWFHESSDSPLRFPILIYERRERIEVPGPVVPGGSWSAFCETPWFAARRAIFESLYMPYQFPGLHLHVRHAILLWPRINLSVYSLLSDPRRVFVRDRYGRCVAEFQFHDSHIALHEATAPI